MTDDKISIQGHFKKLYKSIPSVHEDRGKDEHVNETWKIKKEQNQTSRDKN